MDNKIAVLTFLEKNNYISFYFPIEYINNDVKYNICNLDLRMLDISVNVNNKKYALSNYTVNYNVSDDKMLSLLAEDIMHIAKIYSQFSYTLRKSITPIINDYEYKRFNNDRKNIEDAMKFLAKLSSLQDFNSLNERVNSVYTMEIELFEKDNKTIENVLLKLGYTPNRDMVSYVKAVLFKTYNIQSGFTEERIEEPLARILAKYQVDSMISNAKNEDNSKLYNNQKSVNNNSYFFSEDAIINIAKAHNISITKAAAKKINETISSSDNHFKSIVEYENLVIDCINEHSKKIDQNKRTNTLKNNLVKAGFSQSEISSQLIDDFYDYVIKNIFKVPQNFFDTIAKEFYNEINSIKEQKEVDNIIDSSILSFDDVLNTINPSEQTAIELLFEDKASFEKKLHSAKDKITGIFKINNVNLSENQYTECFNTACRIVGLNKGKLKNELCKTFNKKLEYCGVDFMTAANIIAAVSSL